MKRFFALSVQHPFFIHKDQSELLYHLKAEISENGFLQN